MKIQEHHTPDEVRQHRWTQTTGAFTDEDGVFWQAWHCDICGNAAHFARPGPITHPHPHETELPPCQPPDSAGSTTSGPPRPLSMIRAGSHRHPPPPRL